MLLIIITSVAHDFKHICQNIAFKEYVWFIFFFLKRSCKAAKQKLILKIGFAVSFCSYTITASNLLKIYYTL